MNNIRYITIKNVVTYPPNSVKLSRIYFREKNLHYSYK